VSGGAVTPARSIQEEKLKSAQDKVIQAAEQKKDSTRRKIAKLREDLATFLKKNRRYPPEERLEREDIQVDPYLR
jgi:hypothetical protein